LILFLFAIASYHANSEDLLDRAKKLVHDTAGVVQDQAMAAGHSVSEKLTEVGSITSEKLKSMSGEVCKEFDEQTCKAKEVVSEQYETAKVIAENAKEKIIKATAAGLDASKGFVSGAADAIKDQAAYVHAGAKHGLDSVKHMLEHSSEGAKAKYVEVTDKATHDAESVQHSAEAIAHRLSESVHDSVESARHVAEDIVHGVEHEVDHLKHATHDAIEYSQEHAPLDMETLKPPDDIIETVMGHAKKVGEKVTEHTKQVGEKVTEHAKGFADKVKEFMRINMGL